MRLKEIVKTRKTVVKVFTIGQRMDKNSLILMAQRLGQKVMVLKSQSSSPRAQGQNVISVKEKRRRGKRKE